MQSIRPFGWTGVTVNTAVTGTSANVAVTRPGIGTQTVRIVNVGTNTIFIEMGTSSGITATTTTSMPMLANTVETFLLPNNITHIAAISSGAGSTMYVTTGESA